MFIIAILNFLILRNKPSDMGYPTVSEIDGIDYYPAQAAGQKTTFKENFVKLLKMMTSSKVAKRTFLKICSQLIQVLTNRKMANSDF